MRLAELEEAYVVMSKICSGKGVEVAKRNLRYKGATGVSSDGLNSVDFESWKGRFYLDHVTIISHFFGSTTTVEVLRHAERFQYVEAGIIYDIWGMSVREPDQDPKHHIHAPVLGINSEAFMYWDANFDVARSICTEAQNSGSLAWLLTVRGTVHISQSDFCILYPHIASLVMKTTMDPIRAVDVNIDASLDFLSRVITVPEPQPFRRMLPERSFLDLPVVGDMPVEHKPDKIWTTVRLKVHHEARKRMRTHARERYWQNLLKQDDQDEVWVHMAPSNEHTSGRRNPENNNTHATQEHNANFTGRYCGENALGGCDCKVNGDEKE